MFMSRIALRATAEGGDRYAIVLDKNIPSHIIAFRQTMSGCRHARRASRSQGRTPRFRHSTKAKRPTVTAHAMSRPAR
jgi:hypothetical protein